MRLLLFPRICFSSEYRQCITRQAIHTHRSLSSPPISWLGESNSHPNSDHTCRMEAQNENWLCICCLSIFLNSEVETMPCFLFFRSVRVLKRCGREYLQGLQLTVRRRLRLNP